MKKQQHCTKYNLVHMGRKEKNPIQQLIKALNLVRRF